MGASRSPSGQRGELSSLCIALLSTFCVVGVAESATAAAVGDGNDTTMGMMSYMTTASSQLQNVTEVAHHSNITIGVMVSMTGPKRLGSEASAAIQLSFKTIRESDTFAFVRSLGYQFEFLIDNVPCEPSDAFAQMMDIFSQRGAHEHGLIQDAFVGPSCDEVCQPGGRLAKYYDVMMISYGCESSIFDNKKEYPTFGRTTPTFKDMEVFFADIIDYYKWPRVTLVTMSTPVWQETLSEFEEMITDRGVTVRRWTLEKVAFIGKPRFMAQLREESRETRIYILLMYPDSVIEFMREMDAAGLRNGENAFLSVDYAGTHKRTDFWNATFLDGMLDVTYDVLPETDAYKDFLNAILNTSHVGLDPKCTNYEYGIHPLLISDGIYVIAGAFNISLRLGIPITKGAVIANQTRERIFSDKRNGGVMSNLTYGKTFTGFVHPIEIDDTGKRTSKLMLHNIQSGCYVPIGRTQDNGLGISFLGNPVIWPGGSTVAPLGRGPCGWHNELCPGRGSTLSVITGSFVGAILFFLCIIVAVLIFLIWRRNLRQSRMLSTSWLKEWEDIKWRVVDPFSRPEHSALSLSKSIDSLGSNKSEGSGVTGYTRHTNTSTFRCPVVRMDVEGIWAFKMVRKTSVQLTEAVKRELNQVRSLKHPNINAFMGACVNPGHVSLMWSYSPKGSLMDLIGSGIFKMELMFQLSFAQDIAKGLAYLHNSDLRMHGRLKSSNVVVDSALTCKLTDIDMPKFREGEQDLSEDDPNYWFQCVWTAPERLRDPSSGASQMDDVYAFGIILYEIMLKRKPYITDEHLKFNEEPDWEDIITFVREPEKYIDFLDHQVRDTMYTITEDEASIGDSATALNTLTTGSEDKNLKDEKCSPGSQRDTANKKRGSQRSYLQRPANRVSNSDFTASHPRWSKKAQLVKQQQQQQPSYHHYSQQQQQQQQQQQRLQQQQNSNNNLKSHSVALDVQSPTHKADSQEEDEIQYDEVVQLRRKVEGTPSANRGDQDQRNLPQHRYSTNNRHRHQHLNHDNDHHHHHPHHQHQQQQDLIPGGHSQGHVDTETKDPSENTRRDDVSTVTGLTHRNTRHSLPDDTVSASNHVTGGDNCPPSNTQAEQTKDSSTSQGHQSSRKSRNSSPDFMPAVRFQSTAQIRSLSSLKSNQCLSESKSDMYHSACAFCCSPGSLKAQQMVSTAASPKRHSIVGIIGGSGSFRDSSLRPASIASISSMCQTSPFCRPEIPLSRFQSSLQHHRRSGDLNSRRKSTDPSLNVQELGRSSYSLNRDSRSGYCHMHNEENEAKVMILIRLCWAEVPEKRPTADAVVKKLRSLTYGRSLSDNIEQIMTRYSEQLEETVNERTRRLEEEKAKYFRVLCEVIPQKYVGALVSGGKVEAESFPNVTVFFSDIVGFTSICGKCSPQEVLDFLNELYTRFDVVLNSYNVYKVETIGDAYMVAGGIPEPIPDHAQQIAYMALHLLSVSVSVRAPYVDRDGIKTTQSLKLRIGLNSGPVVTGIVGEKMPRYCLYGNTVNIASRMESNGKPLRIHMSKDTTKELEAIGGFDIQYRGMISVKGKDKPVPTYWLINSKLHPFDLPDWTSFDDDDSH